MSGWRVPAQPDTTNDVGVYAAARAHDDFERTNRQQLKCSPLILGAVGSSDQQNRHYPIERSRRHWG
jgi:hypothetical protein